MKLTRTLGAVLGGAALVMSAACSQDLNVPNTENPDVARALANPGDVENLANSGLNAWYYAAAQIDPWQMLNVTGDIMTANFGNFGMRFNNLEPRIPYANDPANGDIEVARNPWNNWYQSLGSANDVLKAVKGGLTLPDGTDQYKAIALWTQAASFMELGLAYDKAFVVDETFDPTGPTPQLQPYSTVIATARAKFDALIALTKGQTWTYPSTVMPLAGPSDHLTATIINRIANTQAALMLAYAPRNATDAAKVDWAAVLNYANNGIGTGNAGAPFDFSIEGDDNIWYSELMGYEDLPSWMAVDQHLIHQMASCVPDKYDGTNVPPNCAHDARLAIDTSGTDGGLGAPHKSGADFIFGNKVQGDPTRGIYMQSPYYHERYIDVSWEADVSFLGPMPYILAAESDLVRAEALVRTGGDKALAASLINNTRVNRGGLTPILPTDDDATFINAITYEREVECMATDGFGFYAVRHVDGLQPGTVHHLPVPATDLETLGLPVYTFGGVGNPVENVVPVNTGAAGVSLLKSLTSGRTADLALPSGSVMKLSIPGRVPAPRNPTRF